MPAAPAAPTAAAATRARVWLIVAGLVVAAVVAFWPVGACGFLNLDDDAYVEFQPMVNQGLRPAAVAWAFSAAHSGMWHPLTSLSHIVDCELFGVRAAPMHWENLAWHILNAIAVFLVWRALTGTLWRSALVAALFALHPLDVESVAWIAERKNLLTTFFWLLGLGAYVRYARHPSLGRYALATLCFAFALLAKPMAVTFPAALLLLDYWPLRRWPQRTWRSLFLEKIPLFVLGLVHSAVTISAQHAVGAEGYGHRFGVLDRLGNALVSYARYLGKMAWPDSLAAFYPHPGQWPVFAVAGAAFLLIAVTALAWWQRRQQPWLLVGWLWFLGTLVPVIGLLQVGAQAMADRYSYLPLLGIYTALVWSGAHLVARQARARTPVIAAVAALLVLLVVLTRRQVPAWTNSRSLHEHSIAAGVDSATSRYLLAVSLQAAGRPEAEITAQYRRAIELEPDYVNAYTQLAIIEMSHQRPDEARKLIEQTIRLAPLNPGPHKSLAALCKIQQQPDEALTHFQTALRLNPAYADGHHELAWLWLQLQRLDEARAELETVVRLTPWDFVALTELATALANLGRVAEARPYLEKAVWINPRYQPARDNLTIVDRLLQERASPGAKPPG